MARDNTAQCRICRRAGTKLYLKGERCYTPKCAIVKRNYPPGVQGAKKAKPRLTPYGLQLREKQKTKIYYGISESQFRKYFDIASKKTGDTGQMMQQFLEMRMDNVIFSLGFAHSRQAARELVSHGHYAVNGKKVTIPSYAVRVGDVITVRDQKKKKSYFQTLPKLMERHEVPAWLHGDMKTFEGKVVSTPRHEEVPRVSDFKSIVEFYSR